MVQRGGVRLRLAGRPVRCDGRLPDHDHRPTRGRVRFRHGRVRHRRPRHHQPRRRLLMRDPIRVIPWLDLDGGRVVKGVRFADLQDAGDPVELAHRYVTEGADELTFLDVSATLEGRSTTLDALSALAAEISIPITVGGGVRSAADAARLREAGAAKISVNTAAIARPELLTEIARECGSKALVLSIDARRGDAGNSGFDVTTHGGKRGARSE